MRKYCLLHRDAPLTAASLDSRLLPISGVADAIVWHSAHSVRTTTDAHRQAPSAVGVSNVERVPAVAGALVRAGALAVQARIFAHRIHGFSFLIADASTATGIVDKSRITGAQVRWDALAVRAAVAIAV